MSNTENKTSSEFASFGAIHLKNTCIEKSCKFWTEIVGLKLLYSTQSIAEFGTDFETLIVVHKIAKRSFKHGFSGLYHFAIHAPNEVDFAVMLNRLIIKNHPYSLVDHTMSKSIYLNDPDGINIEFTLETPERFKRLVTTGGLNIEGSDGKIRPASDRLDINEVLCHLNDKVENNKISNNTYLGHLHLYANNVQNSNSFYNKIGFNQFNYLPKFLYADLSTGGDYQHRLAMNSWHGNNRPLAPTENAGLKHFKIKFKSKDKLTQALINVNDYVESEDGYWVTDPTGNSVLLQ